MDERLREIIEARSLQMGDNDGKFLKRVFATDDRVYAGRLDAVGFAGLGRVLDAGCGFGQWTLQLARRSDTVDALDTAPHRLATLSALADRLGLTNIRVRQARIEQLPYVDSSFDAIFCYGAMQYTAWRDAIREFARTLKRGGLLYLTANGLGWYLHLWKNQPNAAADYDPRRCAAESFLRTVAYDRDGRPPQDGDVIIDSGPLLDCIRAHRMEVIGWGGEGTLCVDPALGPPTPFFKSAYEGEPGCYEVLARLP
jgi:SAM-dependent methyltransferase